MSGNLREIINGAILPQYIGKEISLTGQVQSVHPNGLSFELQTCDDVTVKVNLKKPFRDSIEGYVEVQGVAQASNVVVANNFVLFPPSLSEELDKEAHKKLTTLLHSIPDLWKTMP